MSRIVYRPPGVHMCRPCCEEQPADPAGSLAGKTLVGEPPLAPDFPRGTVWECDCGTRWISRGVITRNYVGALGGGFSMDQLEWRREGWFARWRRLRMEQRDV